MKIRTSNLVKDLNWGNLDVKDDLQQAMDTGPGQHTVVITNLELKKSGVVENKMGEGWEMED